MILSAPRRVGVVDDRLWIVLGSERTRGVVQARPLEHQLDGEVVPRLAAVAGDERELGEVVHDFVDELDVLAGHLADARPGHARAHEDRDVELAALRVERVELLVVDRHLREAAGRERSHRADAVASRSS